MVQPQLEVYMRNKMTEESKITQYRNENYDELGNTLHIKGEVYYQGGRDVLNKKLRQRDDEIDRLRKKLRQRDDEINRLRAEIVDLKHQIDSLDENL
jgi:predicted RNase H-like nuclease (RuvC/YqgF family)